MNNLGRAEMMSRNDAVDVDYAARQREQRERAAVSTDVGNATRGRREATHGAAPRRKFIRTRRRRPPLEEATT